MHLLSIGKALTGQAAFADMTGTVELRTDRRGMAGRGGSLLSVNPARPTIVVAQGDSATTAELETAVDAARAARARGRNTHSPARRDPARRRGGDRPQRR